MIIPVPEAGKIGVVTDRPLTELPLNAWTDCQNVRFREGCAEKFLGEQAVLGSPLWPPHWLLNTSQAGLSLWLYLATTKAGATDGTTHADATRASGNYTANPLIGWTGTVIEGVPVVNNGVDIPQMWNKPALSQKLADLTAWPSNLRCNTLTGLKRYLVALDCFKSGVRYPTMIKWSHQAPTGDVPVSWDETDDSLDAGEYTLPGEAGFIVDGVTLRDHLILYREFQTWAMHYVAGLEIFRFNKLFDNIGALSRRCALEFFSGKHLVFTGDDVILHDGNQASSLLSRRARRLISGKVDPTNYGRSFVVADNLASEVWVAFPENGQEFCTKALVWNWLEDTWGERDLPAAGHIANGIVSAAAVGETWDSAVGDWDSDSQPWGDRASDPTKRQMLMAVPGDAGTSATWRLISPGFSNQFQGVNMTSYVEKRSIGFPTARTKAGEFPPDYQSVKQVLGIWPRVDGTLGGKLKVHLGLQDRIGGPVDWQQPEEFEIGSTEFCDFSGVPASKLHALKIESDSDIEWRLAGYDAEVIYRGARG